ALYDAVIAAADHLAKNAQRPKQVILIVTDGKDNSSSATVEQTVQRIQILQMLSDQTGGIAFFPKSLDQVDAIAAEVARDIREQYILGYHPTRPVSEGGYRTIHVTASAPGYGKLTVRTREGYMAQTHANSPGSPPTG